MERMMLRRHAQEASAERAAPQGRGGGRADNKECEKKANVCGVDGVRVGKEASGMHDFLFLESHEVRR